MNTPGIWIDGDNHGTAINTGHGSIININIADQANAQQASLNRDIYRLLKLCEFHDIKMVMERIALGLYGRSYFKGLSIEQVNKLQLIAMEIGGVLSHKPATITHDSGFGWKPDGPLIGETVAADKNRRISGGAAL